MDYQCNKCKSKNLHPYHCKQWRDRVQADADIMVKEIESQKFYIHPFTGEKIDG